MRDELGDRNTKKMKEIFS